MTTNFSCPPSTPPKIENNGYTHEFLLGVIKKLGYNSFEELKQADGEAIRDSQVVSASAFHYLRMIMLKEYHHEMLPNLKRLQGKKWHRT